MCLLCLLWSWLANCLCARLGRLDRRPRLADKICGKQQTILGALLGVRYSDQLHKQDTTIRTCTAAALVTSMTVTNMSTSTSTNTITSMTATTTALGMTATTTPMLGAGVDAAAQTIGRAMTGFGMMNLLERLEHPLTVLPPGLIVTITVMVLTRVLTPDRDRGREGRLGRRRILEDEVQDLAAGILGPMLALVVWVITEIVLATEPDRPEDGTQPRL